MGRGGGVGGVDAGVHPMRGCGGEAGHHRDGHGMPGRGWGLHAWVLAQGGDGRAGGHNVPAHYALTQPCISLADQEHGLLQAGGEWGEGWGWLLGTWAAGHPDISPAPGPRSSTAGRPWPGPG